MTTVADGSYRSRLLALVGERDTLEALQDNQRRLREVVRRLGPAGLARPYGPGKWTGAEVLAHLVDAEVATAFRVRQVLAEDGHQVQGWDEAAWARTRGPVDTEAALATCTALRTWNLALFRSLTPAQMERQAFHPERGAETLATIIRLLAGHDLNHLAQMESIA